MHEQVMEVKVDGKREWRRIDGYRDTNNDFLQLGRRGPSMTMPQPVLRDGEEVLWIVGSSVPVIMRTR